jgi:3-oxoacyl-[acyl-carrier-protein] synthase-3
MTYSRMIGIGAYLPEKIVTNDDLSKIMDTSDEWIQQRTGIKERRCSAPDEYNFEMAKEASLLALKRAQIAPEDIDMIIVATSTPDCTLPSTACLLQQALGVPMCPAFDINAVCSGFVYACVIADKFIKCGSVKTILVVGSERLTSLLDWTDRSSSILFGDGAGAAILQASKTPGIIDTNLGADGYKWDYLYASNTLTHPDKDHYVKMQGREVFKFAVSQVTESIKSMLADNYLSIDDIDWFVLHQANLRINELIAKQLGLPMEKLLSSIAFHANTSSASIPLLLNASYENGKLKQGNKIICVGFGSGMTWGSILLNYGKES